ncbi:MULTISPECIES: hypothetical protein [unclassified Mesorhizobium]|uniref:hypothetical protein n=1 Tax=unclassified Mesorhizobium TaxID=325217 RepID=UPI001CCB9EB8|nr:MULTISPECIES: hypothetical protein [unclassified Mesorhizobium]MBZ9679645.1 hypothetical protein [Mesorhizobium sp. CO1-1-2]MBZ9925003.1 hypothetical protein [Mesorhizobium sp. BR1-1-4]
MVAIRLTGAAVTLIAFTPIAHAFDWPAQLQKSPTALQAALGSSASCKESDFSVPVDLVDQSTKVQADLLNPITTSAGAFSLGDLSIDYDQYRRFRSDSVTLTTCILGREATAIAYVYNARIFRIAIRYDRCQERREENLLLSKETEFVCSGVDLTEKPFDTSLYAEIKKIPHGYQTAYEWIPSSHKGYGPAEERLLFSLECDGYNELTGVLRASKGSKRCLLAVDNKDIEHWSGAAIYERYEDGYLADEVTAHLAASRLFVDLPAEQRALEAMLPEAQTMISGIQNRIEERLAAKKSKEDAVSDLLGADK